MKIYRHSGKGHYVGSEVIVIAKSLKTAEKIIKDELISCGLPDEELNIYSVTEITNNTVVYCDDGNY